MSKPTVREAGKKRGKALVDNIRSDSLQITSYNKDESIVNSSMPTDYINYLKWTASLKDTSQNSCTKISTT